MMVIMLMLVIIPGILVNRWLTAKERERKRQGFEVKLPGATPERLEERDDDHG